MTINDLEVSVQTALEAMRTAQLSTEIAPAKELFLPDGLSPVIELIQEDGRRKRGSAAAWNWNPQSDRIRISFRPSPVASSALTTPELNDASEDASVTMASSAAMMPEDSTNDAEVVTITPQEVVECCQALAVAERSNRQFIALKWFRDDFLCTVDYVWAKSSQRRQRVLSQAIDMGRIDAKKIHNPKSPQFPTTTITLNRSIPTSGVAPRFQPIAVRGVPVSATLLHDRGSI